MPNSEYLINIISLVSLAIMTFLSIVVASKIERIKQLEAAVEQLKKSLDEMDEQAKLVVRTDIELNKTQEELDKKITGLYALQKLSRAISTTLEENQIFKIMEAVSLEDLGFEKACGLLWDEEGKKFVPHLNIGYTEDDMRAIKDYIDLNKQEYAELIRNGKAFSSISIPGGMATFGEMSNKVFKSDYFIVSPILPKEGNKGFLFVGTENPDVALTEGDEELITILSNQIGQALENARLFEKTWRAHQELEKKVEERTRQLTLALEEVNRISKRKTDFISAVSHELRTPLTSIKGYASILLAGKLGSIPKEVMERLEKINRHSDELTNLVNELLDISRIESGKIAMKLEPLDINAITEKVADLLSVQLKDRQLELSLDISRDAPAVLADRSQIERVFINLIGNALKYTPQGGRITVKANKRDSQVQVDISDTGCGIPKEAQESLFEEFYRVDNPINQQVKGTGLGLALVKHIIEAHGGRIWVFSKVGAGSTFSFVLPQQK